MINKLVMVWLNGMASLEQLEKVYDKNGGGGFLKKHAEQYKDLFK